MHVLLLEIPKLLRGILEHALQASSDCGVLKSSRRALELPSWQEAPPDIVILGLTDVDDTILLPALFARWPQAQVMTLMPAGDDMAIYQVRLGRKPLVAGSPEEIIQILREAVRRKRARVAQ